MTALVFLDTETTSLSIDRRVWEVAMIRRDAEGQRERRFFIKDVDLSSADPGALKIGGFYERHPQYGGRPVPAQLLDRYAAAKDVEHATRGATIIGAVPSFDTDPLAKMLRAVNLVPAWHYRLICVESLAAGKLGRLPGGLTNSAAALGVDVDLALEHTALGDARTAMRIWDAVMGGAQ